MAGEKQSSVLDVDVSTLVSDLRDTADGTVFAVVAFDQSGFDLIYVDDATRNFYDSEAGMHAHFERIHSYVHLDFMEMGLFTDDLFPLADRVDYMVTAMDFLKLVRLYHGERGLFLSVHPDEPVEPLVDLVDDHFSDT